MKKGNKKGPVTADTPLTFRERKFLDAYFMTNPPFNGSAAARAVGFSPVSAAVQAVRLLIKDNIKCEIEKRKAEILRQSDVTVDQWRQRGERFYHADVRKMFDTHGNVFDIPDLADNEAAMIAGFEIVEDFTKVKKANGTDEAVATGYTKKFKLVDPMKAHEYYGKIRGFITEEVQDESKIPRSLNVTFVSARGNKIQVNTGTDGRRQLVETNERALPAPVHESPPVDNVATRLGVKFASSKPRE